MAEAKELAAASPAVARYARRPLFFPPTFFATTPAVGRCPTSRLPPRDRAAELGKSPAAALFSPVFTAQKSFEASACIESHVSPKHRNGASGTRRKKQLRFQHVRRQRWSGPIPQPIGFSRISLPRGEPQPVDEFAGDVSDPHRVIMASPRRPPPHRCAQARVPRQRDIVNGGL